MLVKKLKDNTKILLSIVVSSLTMLALTVTSFGYWQRSEGSFNIPTQGFNATDDEFTYYACVPNVIAQSGFDYYDLEEIPVDLVDQVTALAVVRFEALTTTAYIPSFPKVIIGGTKFNYDENNPQLPVIHILSSLSSDGRAISNGFDNIETLILPETLTYIQEGAFKEMDDSKRTLKEVSFLGTNENSGYVHIFEDEFYGIAEKDIHFQAKNNYRITKPYTLTNSETYYRFRQFNGDMEFDNMKYTLDGNGDRVTEGVYYTMVIPNQTIPSGSSIINEAPNVKSSLEMNKDTKYMITFDGTTLNISEYSYTLNYNGLSEKLVMNPVGNYEEYIISTNQGTIEINNYPEVSITEHINDKGVRSSKVTAKFQLSKLNASYSRDNNVFEIKYAPSHVYKSIHYYNDGNSLLDEETLTQISVEKAYFLNQVETKIYEQDGEKFVTVSVPNNGKHLGLYIRGGFSSKTNTYYIENESEYIKMSLLGDKSQYIYEFRSSKSPVKDAVPDEFTFFEGQYSVVTYPSYVSQYDDELTLRDSLNDNTNDTTRIYFDLTQKDKDAEKVYEGDHHGADKLITHHWYLVYWVNGNDGKEGPAQYFRIFHADESSTYLIADVPNIADKFKFARIPADKKIEDCLKDNWAGVSNQTAADFTFKYFTDHNTNLIVYENFWGDLSGKIYAVPGQKVTDVKMLLRNKNYLVLDNYGDTIKTTKYIPLDENLGLEYKDIVGTDGAYNLEFLKYANHENNYIQQISLPKGTKISAAIYDINNDKYYDNYYGYPQVENGLGISAKDTNEQLIADISTYFTQDTDKSILVMQDCTVEVYLKVNYDAVNTSATAPLDYGWYFQIKSNTLSGIERTVVVDDQTTFTSEYNLSGVELDKITPQLKGVSDIDPIKLVRNYTNTKFEEYYYQADYENDSLNPSNNEIKYVVSHYADSKTVFGGNSGNSYYGVINPSSPSGELSVDANAIDNIIRFTPNYNEAYGNSYYAAFDEYDNFIGFLTYNETQSLAEGYQCFSMSLPQTIKDYQKVYVYEVDENGNKLQDTPLNNNAVISDMLSKYNFDSGLTANDKDIVFDQQNELLFDYYLVYTDSNNETEAITNNIGFSYYVEESGDKLYYFDNVYLSLSTQDSTKDHYLILNKNGDSIKLSNEILTEKDNNGCELDEQIIDGYYYNDLGVYPSVKDIRFFNDKFEVGYYDLVLRERNGKFYLGYRYLGDVNKEESYYIHFYQGETLLDVITMESMKNNGHYFADINYEGTITKVQVYNYQGVLGLDLTKEFESTKDKVSRFYFAINTTLDGTNKLVETQVGQIGLIYHFGSYPKAGDENINVRYTPNIYVSDNHIFNTQIEVDNIERYYALVGEEKVYLNYDEDLSKGEAGIFTGYIVTKDFNQEIIVYEQVEVAETLISQPGKYYLTYHQEGEYISCIKVQEPDEFFVRIDGEEYITLIVNSGADQFFEYTAEDYFILQKDLNLEKEGNNLANKVEVVDLNGNVMTNIEKVTLNGESVTYIPSGVYTLNYSVDSSRRTDDQYLVFTYFNLIRDENIQATVTYHYNNKNQEGVTITKIVANDGSWKYKLINYSDLKATTPVGHYFDGWRLEENSSATPIKDGATITITGNVDLYPVYVERKILHDVIWLSDMSFDSMNDVVFTFTNMDNSQIVSVTHANVDISKYVAYTEDKKFVIIKSSAFERIGYTDGGIELTVNFNYIVDGKAVDNYNKNIIVNYPNFTNKIPSDIEGSL